MNSHTRTVAAVTLAAILILVATACTADRANESSSSPTIAHVHDVAFDRDGALLVGAHSGVYRVEPTTDELSLVGDTTFDAMGLTVQADTVLASGHPGPDGGDDTFTAPNVGLVRRTDAGWEVVSLAGITDFHMLATTPAAPDMLLGLPSDRAFLAASTDAGQTWVDIAPLTARDISIDTIRPEIVTATTPDGVMVSRDGGATFTPLVNAPVLLVIAADPTLEEGIIGIDADGTIWTGTTKAGTAWSPTGHATGVPSAIAASREGILAIADEGGVRVTKDSGTTWQVVVRTEP